MKNEYDLADGMNEIVVTEDEVGNLVSVNQAFCRCFGVTPEEAEGMSIFDFILPQDRARCNVENVVSPENPYYRIEGRSKRADGKIIWLQYMGRGFFDEKGKTTGFREIAVDITEWKEKIDESAREVAKANEWIEKMGSLSEIGANKRIDRKTGRLPAVHKFSDICTRNSRMKELISYAKAISPSNTTVLIEGESGTGKELFAQAIHNESLRAAGPFVAVNCGIIPENLTGSEFFGYVDGAFTGAAKGGRAGKFEMANGGTLFLDEIGEMPLSQQVALLRVLETRTVSRIGGYDEIPVDVRIIC
ncbi:MAG: sigma 54-interacting transcriptional regulator, partial [Eubacteriales bacterium]|nr:sigma 54-interacting transcriptional regulator [Eubacteriales bacterium]